MPHNESAQYSNLGNHQVDAFDLEEKSQEKGIIVWTHNSW